MATLDLETAIRNALIADAAISPLISARAYLMKAPDNVAFPCIIFGRDSTSRTYSLSTPTLAAAKMTIDCYGTESSDAVTLRNSVLALFSGFRGTLSGIDIQSCFCQDDGGAVDELADDVWIYRYTLVFEFTYRE